MESRRRNEILAWIVMAVLGLNLIGSTAPSYRCFVEGRALTYSGEGRWSTAQYCGETGRMSIGGKVWAEKT
jgi:hypothetical protein